MMTITKITEQLSKLGLPKSWQLYILLHALLSISIIFMESDFLLNISNIIITSLVVFGLFAGFIYHNHKLSEWKFLLFGVTLICFSIVLGSLMSIGFNLNPIIILGIEQTGVAFISLFSFSIMLRIEKQYQVPGFIVDFSLIISSIILFLIIISPNLTNEFLYNFSFLQQKNIILLFFCIVFLVMATLNQILSRILLLKDIIRIVIILFLGFHFGLEVLKEINYTSGNNAQLTRVSWVFYHLAGTLAIAYIFLERLVTDFHSRSVARMNNNLMVISSIVAIVAIPLGLIIRDRLGSPPISMLLIGIASFILSSIVIWRLQKLIQSIHQQRETLKTIAYTDPLTSLFNYHGYLKELSNKNTENLLVVGLNVEDFKSINDLYGRDFGDEVLKSLASRLKKTPGITLAARTGSDYFQAVFRTSEVNIPILIDKIQDHLSVWDTVNNRRIAVPLTFGASYSRGNIQPEQLVREAEQALKISRNTHTDFTLYSKSRLVELNQDKNLPRHELREILQKAVDDNYLPIHFQPIYDLNSGALKALELLIRAESKAHGLLLPRQFLKQAQAYGLLTSLTRVCIKMVGKCYGQLPDVTININVPPYMLDNEKVLTEFIACFEQANLPMGRFCIEITEDGDIPTDHLIPSINLLKSHGFKIAMDDFGTGYSSLSRLSVLPVDVVKIDRSLLLAASAGNKSILESAISLTKRLGASTVVEGVETLEQLSLIRQLGADSVQGFLLSKPVQFNKASFLSLNATDIIPEF